MKIVVAIDSFKGSVSSSEGASAIARGLKEADPGFEVVQVDMADGGEGTIDSVFNSCGGEKKEVIVSDPLGRECHACYLLLPDRKTALVELAQASGLTLIGDKEQNPLKTTTLGTGEVILHAVKSGATRIVLAVGGSATNDGGVGICKALGVSFLTESGEEVPPTGESLVKIERADLGGVFAELSRVQIVVATDVRNTLFGPQGAACVYAPQKGAGGEEVKLLDKGLRNLARVIKNTSGIDVSLVAGTGAAGGVGAGLAGLFNASIVPGFDVLSELIELERIIKRADLVITGEGSIDGQTLSGKVVLGIGRLAKKSKVPAIAIGGRIKKEAEALKEEGIIGFFTIVPGPVSMEESMRNGKDFLQTTARRIGYLIKGLGLPQTS